MNTRLPTPTASKPSVYPANLWRTGDNEPIVKRSASGRGSGILKRSTDTEGAVAEIRAMSSGLESPAPTRLEHAVWSVVLAGGEGQRLRPLMERWWGAHRPKQYCTFVGQRSMLQHTLDRAESLSGSERLLIVVASHHEPHKWNQLDHRHTKALVVQPRNGETAAGIFLPLAYIGAKDPNATVVIFPSDHFVHPKENFVSAVRRAALAAQQLPDKLILLGARPDNPETEYGWIQPGEPVTQIEGHQVREVAGFREKPDLDAARRLQETGALWNTFVIAAKWRTLWRLGWQCFPALMERFEDFAPHIGTPTEQRALESIYDELPALDFSSGLLQRMPEASVVMELQGVTWCDWGNEERITETLRGIGKTPLFPTLQPLGS